jgi:hypothetical protein
MEQKSKLKYLNTQIQIVLVGWREIYLLSPELIELKPEFY